MFVVHGVEDLISLEASLERTQVLADARYLALGGVGHFPHLEALELFFPAIGRYLDGQWPKEAIEAA